MAFFNPFRPSYVQDPYPALHRLRAEEPVHRSETLDAWVVTSYALCVEVLRDHERFSSDLGRARGRLGERVARQRSEALLGGATRMVSSDPPEHTRLRSLVSRAFTPRYVEGMRGAIESEVERLLAAVEPGGPFDLMTEFAEPLPAAVIAYHLGASDVDRERVLGWAHALMRTSMRVGLSVEERTAAERAKTELTAYIDAFTREGSGGGLIGTVARDAAERLTPDELLELTIDLALAGNDTTANMLGNGVLALTAHPEQQARLREQPELLANGVEEMLRWDAPTQVLLRIVASDTTLGRRTVSEGDAVLAVVAAANRDPARFPDPDRFEVTREDARQHLSFGLGPHFCIGAPLARLQGEVAFAALLARFPTLRLAGDQPLVRASDWMMRSARRIPLDSPVIAG